MSRLQTATLVGWAIDKVLNVRIAANLSAGLGDDKKS